MGRGNSDVIYFLEEHEQEIINCCKKAMSNNEVRELLKTKYGRNVADNTYRKFKAKLNLTKNDFLETLLDEIKTMKTSGATDASVGRWLADEHEFEVSRATFSRFKKKYHLSDKDKDPRARDKDALTNRAISQKQITDNNIHQDNIDLAIDNILQQQVTDIKTGLENLDKITKKWAVEFLEKITAYPNESIHDDCVVAFTGGYEKIVSDVQTKRVNVDKWYST